ncbi:MAG: hypothetical protein AB3N33_08620 [Puniceicoccaceae bacterium]
MADLKKGPLADYPVVINMSLGGPVLDAIEKAALPLPPGCLDILQPNGAVVEFCWEADATGAGIVSADATLAATPAP